MKKMKTKANLVLWLALIGFLALFPGVFGIYYTNMILTLAIFSV